MRSLFVLAAAILAFPASAEEPDPKETVAKVVKAAGGEEKILRLFKFKERLNVSPDPDKKGNERTSVCEPPTYWWVGKKERVAEEKEPATFLVWAWTLGALTDPKTKLEAIPEIIDNDVPLIGIRASGTITPAMELYFDKKEFRLARIDWRTDIHRLSDWKECDGAKYPAKCVGFKKKDNKQWYNTEILEIERLRELPAGLKR